MPKSFSYAQVNNTTTTEEEENHEEHDIIKKGKAITSGLLKANLICINNSAIHNLKYLSIFYINPFLVIDLRPPK